MNALGRRLLETHRVPLVGDGGFGARAHPLARELGCSVESLCRLRPSAVLAIHAEDLAAGAEYVTTNSFCAETADEPSAIAREAAVLARRAIDATASERERWCVGTLGPGPGHPSDDDVARYEAAARGLVEGGVDALLIETVRDLRALRAALEGCARADERGELPRWVSLTPDRTGRLAGGASLEDAVELVLAERIPPVLLALNCIPAQDDVLDVATLRLTNALSGRARAGLWPNAGAPTDGAQRSWPIEPEPFASAVALAAAAHRLSVVAGCCGAGAEHVAALARTARQRRT